MYIIQLYTPIFLKVYSQPDIYINALCITDFQNCYPFINVIFFFNLLLHALIFFWVLEWKASRSLTFAQTF